MASTETIPVIDLGPYLAGEPGAMDRTAKELHFALTEIGFYFIVNHGVPRELIAATFAEVKRFHAQPIEKKLALKLNHHNTGYLPMRGNTLRTSTVQAGTKANLNEAFFIKRELPADHPDVIADRRFAGANRWPEGLPGFREVILSYADTMKVLVQKLVRLYARALDLPAAYFDGPFARPAILAAHDALPAAGRPGRPTSSVSRRTPTRASSPCSPPNEVQGLSIRTQSGKWIDAPPIDNAYVVNGGQMLQRWTNDLLPRDAAPRHQRLGRRALRDPVLLRQQHRLAGRGRADHRRSRQAAEISDHLVHRLHDLVPEAELRRAERARAASGGMSDDRDTVPVLDLGPYLAGEPGSRERLARGAAPRPHRASASTSSRITACRASRSAPPSPRPRASMRCRSTRR